MASDSLALAMIATCCLLLTVLAGRSYRRAIAIQGDLNIARSALASLDPPLRQHHTLQKLPPELRRLVYNHVFYNLVLAFASPALQEPCRLLFILPSDRHLILAAIYTSAFFRLRPEHLTALYLAPVSFGTRLFAHLFPRLRQGDSSQPGSTNIHRIATTPDLLPVFASSTVRFRLPRLAEILVQHSVYVRDVDITDDYWTFEYDHLDRYDIYILVKAVRHNFRSLTHSMSRVPPTIRLTVQCEVTYGDRYGWITHTTVIDHMVSIPSR